MTWQGARRTTTTEWKKLRLRILVRDGGRCTWVDNGARCTAPATDVDHVTPAHLGGTDQDDNLRSLCTTHHRTKTAAEGVAARRSAKRSVPPHPGLR